MKWKLKIACQFCGTKNFRFCLCGFVLLTLFENGWLIHKKLILCIIKEKNAHLHCIICIKYVQNRSKLLYFRRLNVWKYSLQIEFEHYKTNK